MERQKYNADNNGPVGERGPAWYDDYTIEELLERIIRDAYAIGAKIGHPPLCEISFQNGIGSLKK
jgi:hypothetical protein